ncbi:hypothetical protein ABZS61_18010 [Streptomyces sp. NPDC005566]|uniref:hypothetical protein n=1 Tax=Streptomyces sp. NPDC005566 TaxID=3156886 RepID=UPI0033AF8EE5
MDLFVRIWWLWDAAGPRPAHRRPAARPEHRGQATHEEGRHLPVDTLDRVGGSAVHCSSAHTGPVTGPWYPLEITDNSTSFDRGTYLFFGWPGGKSC